ncbi:MAG TPA: hypothetical protein DCW74_13590 [Alteromonas australica]|mgnify:CR=1 FL=1|uniref:Glycosyltransferase subfamily 4-like N-terminal domain-containing protein n=1 Tax=Alteromonas australica TaxID=589873 RepID=A0A350P638_9ALTE|nr:hypothetical protein [Alteromonas australica]|tara:strand:+ start:431 stop:1915 length:1485 start_codon:yes stop_codon:yes gene_type:complete
MIQRISLREVVNTVGLAVYMMLAPLGLRKDQAYAIRAKLGVAVDKVSSLSRYKSVTFYVGKKVMIRWVGVRLLILKRKGSPAAGNEMREVTEPRLVVMPVVSEVPADGRVKRSAVTLVSMGYEVLIVAPQTWSREKFRLPSDVPNWGPGISFKLVPNGPDLFAFPDTYYQPLADALMETPAWAYHCHDTHPIAATLIAAAKHNAYCVVDLHELRSENVTYNEVLGEWQPHTAEVRKEYERVERLAVNYADRVITVSNGCAEVFHKKYGKRHIDIIRNIPASYENPGVPELDLRKYTDASSDELVLLYQGGLGRLRLLEYVIEALKFVPKCKFVIRGFGASSEIGKEYLVCAKEHGVEDQVYLMEGTPVDRVVTEMQSADLGICTLSDIAASFRLSLSNKVFEYMAAGLPMIVADYPDMGSFVREHDIGLCFSPRDPRSIASAIRTLLDDREALNRMKQNTTVALRANDSISEWKKLSSIYHEFADMDRRSQVAQ